ncbi:MAG: tetratricopeptide repeat protein [Gemmatimonadota bacterium]
MNATDPHLAAVWFADLVGYSELAARDADGAFHLAQAFHEIVREVVEERRGRVVKRMGDGVLSAFPSTRSAIAAAIVLRDEVRRRTGNAVRIGVHVGDVTGVPDGDLYGDGINVAARLEADALPGQILVSEDVWRQMRQRPGFAFRALGERQLKGTAPLCVYELCEPESADDTAHRVAESAEPSIAVLPFLNMSGDPENEFFADGVTEDIITALSRIHGLKVISRTSAMRYRGATKSLREIGGELGVATVLEGSVRRHGERVRIVAQLADVHTDGHLWAETYDRNLEDIFAIQTEVAQQIAAALEMNLSPRERERIAGRRTESIEAYEQYLLARYHWNERTREGLNTAIGLFEAAIATDPSFPLAYSGLADVWAVIANYVPLSRREAIVKAAEAARRALELDPTLGEAQSVLGTVAVSEWRWKDADRHFRRALELSPGYATAHQWYGESLVFRLRIDEAIARIRRAEELDPCSLIIKIAAARPYLASGRLDEAVRRLRRVIEADPDQPHAHALLAAAYLAKERYEEAIDELAAWQVIPWLDADAVLALRAAYAESGKEGFLRTMLAGAERRDAPPLSIASIHAQLGDFDDAFAVLEAAIEEHDPSLRALAADPLLTPLRNDLRYQQLLERVGLASAARAA